MMLKRADLSRGRKGRFFRNSSRSHRLRGTSRAAAMMWRLAAHGSHPGDPHGLLAIMHHWEEFAHRHWPLRDIPGCPFDLLKFRLEVYHGEALTLPDGTEVLPNTVVGELHCNNLAILRLVQHRQNPYIAARKDLARLESWLEQADPAAKIQAFYGVTMLAPAAQRLGFFVRELPHGVKARLERFFMTGLLLIYTSDGMDRLDKGTTVKMFPREVWLTRRQMRSRYRVARERAAKPPRQQPAQSAAPISDL